MPIKPQTLPESSFPCFAKAPRDSGTRSRTTIPLPFYIQQLCPKTKEAPSQQGREGSIPTELRRESTKCCGNTVSATVTCPGEGRTPRPGRLSLLARGLQEQGLEGQMASGEARHLSLPFKAGHQRGHPFIFPSCQCPLRPELGSITSPSPGSSPS